MQEFYDFFNYTDGITPEIYFKYIVFIMLITCCSRMVGELLNSTK